MSVENYKLEELVDIDSYRKMAELMYSISGFPIGIIDVNNNILLGCGWQKICTKYHRVNSRTCKKCHESDAYIKNNLSATDFISYKCQNGLWDFAYPLIINNKHLATLLLGQFFYEDEAPNEVYFVKQAEKYGFDKENYIKALHEVPKFSRNKVEDILDWNKNLAKSIVNQADKQLRLLEEQKKRIQSEKELQQTSDMLKLIINSAPSRIFWKDVNLNYLGCNQNFANDAGFANPEELIGKSDYDLSWTKSDADKFRNHDAIVINQGSPKLNYIEPRSDCLGNTEWFRTSKIPLFEKDKVFGILGTYENITDSLSAKEKLKDNLKKFKHLSNCIPELLTKNTTNEILSTIGSELSEYYDNTIIIISEIDKSQEFACFHSIHGIKKTVFNRFFKTKQINPIGKQYKIRPAYYDLYYSGDLHFISDKLTDFAQNDLNESLTKLIQKTLKINKIYTIGINRGNRLLGTIHLLTKYNTSIDDREHITAFVRMAGIVLEKKQLENDLMKSEDKFKAIANHAANIEIWLGANKRILWVNPGIKDYIGISAEKLMLEVDPLTRFIYPDDQDIVKRAFADAIEGKELSGENMELRILDQDKNIKDVSINWTKIYDSSKNLMGIRVSGHEITDLKKQQQKISIQNKLLRDSIATKSRLFSIISHDLRNPLNAIQGFSHILNSKGNYLTKEQINKYSGFIYESSKTMYSLLDNLLLWSHLQQDKIVLKPEKLSLNHLFEEVLDLYKFALKNKDLTVDIKVDPLLELTTDRMTISTTIRNIISNAVKFSNHGGLITIHTKVKKNKVDIIIGDKGVGISDEELAQIFNIEHHVSSRGTDGETGTGLGLVMCQDFISKNGGIIKINSNKGEGTEVIISLPLN